MSGRPERWFLTFGHDPLYRKAKTRISEQIASTERFDKILALGQADLGPEFLKRHRGQLLGKGYGYYVWKPWIVWKTLEKMRDGDILFYLDAGFVINVNDESMARLDEYLAATAADEFGWIGFSIPFPIREWTKGLTLERMGVPDEMLPMRQVQSGNLFIRKNERTVAFAREWYEWCARERCALINHSRMYYKRPPGFREHRHDQSVYSVLAYRRGITLWPNETYFRGAWETRGRPYPFWAMRSRRQ